MADNVTVSNAPTSVNPDIPVRTTQTTANKHIQHMRIDVGDGTSESVVSAENPLPVSGTFSVDTSGLATEAKQTTGNTSLASIDSKITACNTGAVTVSTSLPAGINNIGDVDVLTLPNVTLASQGNPFTSAIPISDNAGSITVDGTVAAAQSGTWNITNVSGTISLPSGAATESTLSALNGKVTSCNTGAVTVSTALPAGTNNIGDVDIASLPAVVAATYSTSTVTSVTSAATSTSILATNANRRMAILVNDSDKNAYVKLGATASTTSFSYKLTPGQTLELPIPLYTGAIDAIWESSPTGSMRVTELACCRDWMLCLALRLPQKVARL